MSEVKNPVTLDFYILATDSSNQRYSFICRLLSKAHRAKQSAWVYCQDRNELELLDDMLWTFRDIDFTPHLISEQGESVAAPISIGCQLPSSDACKILINLTTQLIDEVNRFSRIIEVSDQTPARLQCTREHYQHYRQQGLEIATHKIKI